MNTHHVVVDLGYGDAGKGTTVDYLCGLEPTRAVIRFNGGCQAAHNVVTPDGRHHTFAQFGSGAFHEEVRTHLSRYMLLNPLALELEADHLYELDVPNVWERLTVDEYAPVTTPFHVAVNRARERARGDDRHGSCGQGVGETQAFVNTFPAEAIRAMDLQDMPRLMKKLNFLASYYANEGFTFVGESVVDTAMRLYAASQDLRIVSGWETAYLLNEGPCVLEGAQGVLLDEWRGFHPYTTWSRTTFANAEALLQEAGVLDHARRVGVIRAYMTRHGAGPFVTEDDDLFEDFHEPHNDFGEFQGAWRVGHLDFVALRYALRVCGGVNELHVTHLDQAERSEQLRFANYYTDASGTAYSDIGVRARIGDLAAQEQVTYNLFHSVTPELEEFDGDIVGTIEQLLQTEVAVTSYGPTREDKHPVRHARSVIR